jgi:release factor glutamine methyltransferase
MMMKSVSDILKLAAEILNKSGIKEPRREAKSLLAFSLNKDKTFLIAHPEYQLNAEQEKRFRKFLERRAAREPFQYITGKQEFYGLDFIVLPDVLIPRPETEIIVENAVEILKEIITPRFCEIGVGSGCISISILNEVKTATAIGVDISENALQIARKNVEKHSITDRLKLKISDVFSNLKDEKFDLIVSNPPYIPETDLEDLQAEVKNFEPHSALFAKKDGLEIVEKIINKSPRYLKTGGFLLIEIGINQSETVEKMFSADIWKSVEFIRDLQEIRRTLKVQIKISNS